jgi:phosphotransferase system enzyme I (PtsI)
MNKIPTQNQTMATIQGAPASPGYAVGPVHIVSSHDPEIVKKNIPPEQVKNEIERFKQALDRAEQEILAVQDKIANQIEEAEAKIFDAHCLIVRDKQILEQVEQGVREEGHNVEYVYSGIMKTMSDRFDSLDDDYFKSRGSDIRDVLARVLHILQEKQGDQFFKRFDQPVVIVAEELSPLAFGQLNKRNTLGFVTEVGGETSHVSILARSLEIPALVGVSLEDIPLREGDIVALDGENGLLIPNPTEELIQEYQEKRERYKDFERRRIALSSVEAKTIDGAQIHIAGNIELPVETSKVQQYGSDSIGLYRSEFLFLTRDHLPTEEEQYQAYRFLAEQMPNEVVIRTFDSGGDKLLPQLHTHKEENPFMGWRSLRVCLDHPDLFCTQLRAILRASVHGNIQVMFPLVLDSSELKEAKKWVHKVMGDLEQEGIPYNRNIPLGCMIEVPSAVLLVDEIAQHADFLSIGTNDLTQFTLAVDRGNKKMSGVYQPHHPAVLKMIHLVAQAGEKHGIPVCVCGEMAGNPLTSLALIALGVRKLSMSPTSIPEIKQLVHSISLENIKSLRDTILSMNDGASVKQYLKSTFQKELACLPSGDVWIKEVQAKGV